MRPFIPLTGLVLALSVNFSIAQNCVSYASSVALTVGANITNPSNSLNAPNGTVTNLPDDNDIIVWNMGTVLPIGTQICVKVKKETSSGGNYDFKIWSGADGINVTTGTYIQLASYTEVSNSTLEDRCVTLTVASRYIKVTHEDASNFSIDAVTATITKPNAGSNQTVCLNTTASLSASPAGGQWSLRTSPANPDTATFANANNASTTVSGLTVAGTYGFIWTIGGICKDTVLVVVSAKPNAGTDKTAADIYSSVTMSATAISGGIWTGLGTNPGLYEITDDNSATTTIGSFSVSGVYKFIWSANGCSDTASVTVGNCDCPDNKIENASFELGTGAPSSWTTGGSFASWQKGSYAAQCGSGNAAWMDGNSNSSLAVFYQDETITGGSQIALKFKAGTHDPAQTALFGLVFYNGNTRLDSVFLQIDHVLGDGSMAGYTINQTAPASANKVRVIGKVGSDWLKVDVVCLNVTGGCTATAGNDGDTAVCNNTTAAIILGNLITGESTGGVWSRATGSNGTFNAGAGTFTPASNATSSTFRYVITGTGGCPNDTSIATVTLTSPPNAGSNGSTSVCDNSTATITLANLISGESTGGTWSRATGSGGTFNAGAGTFTPASGATTSTFRYIITGSGGCPNDTSIATVTISSGPNAGSNGSTAVCDNSTTPISLANVITGEATGGAWSRATGTGGTFVAGSGTFTPAAGATTSTFRYVITGSASCPNDTSIATVTISSPPNAGSNGSTSVCDNSTTAITLANLITGESTGGTWSRATGTGGTFNSGAGTFTPASGATTSTFRYIITGSSGCPNDTSIATVTITSCCDGRITSLYFNKLSGSPDLAITQGGIYNLSDLSNLYNLEASVSGTVQSVKFTITGPSASTVTDNSSPYNTPASGAWTPTAGAYSVNLKVYSADNATGTLCHDTTVNFTITNIVCNPDAGTDGSFSTCAASTFSIDLFSVISNEVTGGTWSRVSGTGASYTNGSSTFNPSGATSNYVFRYVKTGVSPCPNDTSIATITISPTCPTTTTCFVGTNNNTVTAKMITTIIGDKIKIWTQLSKTFVDNTYGTNAIGWNNHTFKMLYQSDQMQLALYDNANAKKLEFKMDYLSADASVSSGYKSLGVTGGDGVMMTGSASSVVSVYTSMDKNFNELGYVLTENSPATDSNFTPNPTYPNWIFDVWYEVVVDAAAFGASGFKNADITGMHASPSKTGVESEPVDEGPCCTAQVTGLFFKHLSGGANIPIVEGGTYNLNSFNDLYDLEATTSGTVGSVKFTVGLTGQTGTSTTENTSPYNANWDPQTAGSYTVHVEVFSGSNLSGTLCDEYYFVFNVATLGSIGDYVWLDADGDGQQESSEHQLKGIIVTLTKPDNSTVKDTTDNDGKYLFTNLLAGTYSVSFAIPSAYTVTSSNVGSDNTDSDINASGIVSGIVLASGQTNLTIDAGLKVTNCDCPENSTNLISNPGFEDPLVAGYWTVSGGTLTTGDGYQMCGSKNAFLDHSSGTARMYREFSNVNAGSIVSLNIYAGTHTAGQACSPWLKLIYLNASGVSLKRDSVDLDKDVDVPDYLLKYFTISGVAPAGTAKIRVEITINCDFVKLDGFCLTASATSSLGNFVWHDINGDGIQDAGEPGISGVSVTLTNVTTSVTTGSSTDANGKYLFTGLAAGTYKVTFGTPSGYSASPVNAGADDKDSDASGGMTGNYVLASGQVDTTVDAGFFKTASLGNFVWNDLNADGDQDAGEPGIGSVSVTLTNVTTSVTTGSSTDANGKYLFSGLTPGIYKVTFGTPSGFTATSPNIGADDKDSDASGGISGNYFLVSGQVDTTVDAGFYKTAALGNFVWNDLNADGDQDAGEPGIGSASVTLTNVTTSVTSGSSTDVNGRYIFSGLTPGTYKVTFGTPVGFTATTANVGADDKDSDASGGMSGNYTLISGQSDTTVDAGFYKTASLGNFVWHDLNADGDQDAGEPGIASVSVTLTNVTTSVTSGSSTDANGRYIFTGLTPGTYKVTFGTPSGFTATIANTGADDKDSDASGGMTGNYTLISGQSDTTVDAGFYKTASLGNFVWNDSNADGDQDAGEAGIASVSVTLTNVTTSVTTGSSTDANGKYLFTGLTPGTYKVTFGTPSGFIATSANVGADDKDSDAGTGGMTGNYVLTSGQVDTTVDAGFLRPASLGNFVWDDLNIDGDQDPGELGIGGVSVKLTNVTTSDTTSTTTDAFGKYWFTGLKPGTYKVTFSTPLGYQPTNANIGADDKDSDADFTTGMTGNYILIAGQVDSTVDAGFRLPGNPIMPDLQPTISVLPTSFTVGAPTYSRTLRVVVRINEVEDIATTGDPIVVRIPRTSKLTFIYNPSLTSLGPNTLQNSMWTFTSTALYWEFTYNGVFPAYGESKFGFEATFMSEGETGQMFFNSIIVNGSGGETNFLNNVDDERIDYITSQN